MTSNDITPDRLTALHIEGLVTIVTYPAGRIVATLMPDDAIALASSLANQAAACLNDTAPDLASHLTGHAVGLNGSLVAFLPALHTTPMTWHENPFTSPADYPPVPPTVTKVCDNTSVGVIITDPEGRHLLFTRATPPAGVAPSAGHIDDHGTPEDAARAEVHEETGLTVTTLTPLINRWRHNVCRRQHGGYGPGHEWTIYRAVVTGELKTDPREARDARWYTSEELQTLAERTARHANGWTSTADFTAEPGIEPVWADFLHELGLINLPAADLWAINRLASRSPYAFDGGTR